VVSTTAFTPFVSVDPQLGVLFQMPTLAVAASRIISDPKAIFTVDPIAKTVSVEVTETCPSCQGYGSPCGGCDGSGAVRHVCGSFDPQTGALESQNALEEHLGFSAARDVMSLLHAIVG
jgi:hypothetical protein